MVDNRKNSLSPIDFTKWSWQIILNDLIEALSVFDIEPYPIPEQFLSKKVLTNLQKAPTEVSMSTWACTFNKIKQARVSCIDGGRSFSIFNLVIHPLHNFDLPFFGADFVTLPKGHLLALDLQPVLKMDQLHTKAVWSRLRLLHERWQSLLPFGGEIPKEAKPFFSPGFLWTRLPLDKQSDDIILEVIRPAFREYLYLYIDLIRNASSVSNSRALQLLEGQKLYLTYRSQKDPARAMLTRIFGKEWTEKYITEVLFTI